MKKSLTLFHNRSLYVTLASIIGQQMCVAFGTYAMGIMAAQASRGEFNLYWGILLLVSITLPGSFFHFIISILSVRSAKTILGRYIELYSNCNFNRPLVWRDQNAKSEKHDFFVKPGPDAIESSLHFTIDLFATSLNIILNSIAIFLITDFWMIVTISVAGALGLFAVHLRQHKISQNTEANILAEGKLTQELSKSWDNIILGNLRNFEIWRSRAKRALSLSETTALQATSSSSLIISAASLVTTGVVLTSTLVIAFYNRGNATALVGLFVMLPRSLQIAAHIQIVQSYFAQWASVRTKLTKMAETLDPASEKNMDQFMDWTRMNVEQTIGTPCDIVKATTGRWTITGDNGAGKTVYAMKLKKHFGSTAVFVPAHHSLVFQDQDSDHSTGQSAMEFLQSEIANGTHPLILDEWDANLSQENKHKWSQILDSIAKKRLVIEIRHGWKQ